MSRTVSGDSGEGIRGEKNGLYLLLDNLVGFDFLFGFGRHGEWTTI